MAANKIIFVKGRLKFGTQKAAAPFPSCVVVFDKNSTPLQISTTSNKP